MGPLVGTIAILVLLALVVCLYRVVRWMVTEELNDPEARDYWEKINR